MSTIDTTALDNEIDNGDILVFTKSTWAGAFTLDSTLIVEEVVWSVAPQISTASLQRRYGTIFQPGSATSASVSAMTTRGYYVLILVPVVGGGYLPWLGYADKPITIQEDLNAGTQRIPCYGFDRALQYSYITTAVHVDPADSTAWLRNDLGSTFNKGLKGNRSAAKVKLDPLDATASVYAFENPGEGTQDWWSTQDIVHHLSVFHLPTPASTPDAVPWEIVGDTRLPDWDHPELKTEGRTIHECLTELANADRVLGWRVIPTVSAADPLVTAPTVSAINIEFFTRTATAITLPDVTNLPANHDVQTWVVSSDRLTSVAVDEDDTETVDQVIVRGPREVAIGTFSYGTEWDNAWTPTELTEYNAAATGITGYAALSLEDKRMWNQYIRQQPKYDHVYRDYLVPDNWDGTCNSESLFWKSAPTDPNYIPYLGNTFFLDDLPLFRGVDYSGSVPTVDESAGRKRLPILAWIERPESAIKYFPIQNALTEYGGPRSAYPNALEYDLDIKPYFDRGPGFQLLVRGAPQHAHRGTNFTGNADDPEKVNPKMWGELDSETIQITAAMVGDRRPEVRNPASVSADFVRRKYITLEHPGLLHVQIAAGTVVGLDHTGAQNTSDGGTLRDPFTILTALAELAGARFLSSRKTARIVTGRSLNVSPGSLINTIDGESIQAIITEVRVESPVTEDDSPPPFRMHITAIDNDFDLVSMVARVPEPEVD